MLFIIGGGVTTGGGVTGGVGFSGSAGLIGFSGSVGFGFSSTCLCVFITLYPSTLLS